jgi:hypothetical protein
MGGGSESVEVGGRTIFSRGPGVLLKRLAPERPVTRVHECSPPLLDVSSEERRRLVAMRAAFSLPARDLAHHTKDPLGELAAERYDPLIAAAYDEAGFVLARLRQL